jgi:hypothetical protein
MVDRIADTRVPSQARFCRIAKLQQYRARLVLPASNTERGSRFPPARHAVKVSAARYPLCGGNERGSVPAPGAVA